MKKFVWVIATLTLISVCIFPSTHLLAADNNAKGQINFESFSGEYHLSRDKNGLSLLTAEETILADFPSNPGFYGIQRAIPKKYQNNSVEVKVLNLTDAAGNSLPYKTSTDNDNLVITTGNPAITLYGFQTYKINYQTTGVINLNDKTDEFLLNVNGRGWDQPFSQVNAVLHIPSSFRASLTSDPTCYLVLGTNKTNACSINTQKNSDSSVITSKAGPLLAHQALVIKLDFAPATFTNNHPDQNKYLLTIVAVSLLAIVTIIFVRKNRSG